MEALGQSVWYDNIRRGLLVTCGLERLIQDYSVVGVTSNPTIFHKAITETGEYDRAIVDLKAFRDHGVAEVTLIRDVDGAAAHLAALEGAGVSLAEVTVQLEADGVKVFADSYDALVAPLEAKK